MKKSKSAALDQLRPDRAEKRRARKAAQRQEEASRRVAQRQEGALRRAAKRIHKDAAK